MIILFKTDMLTWGIINAKLKLFLLNRELILRLCFLRYRDADFNSPHESLL